MNKHIRTSNIVVALVLVAAIVPSVLFSAKAYAQTAKLPSNVTANVLKVSPVRSDIEVLPGASKKIQITVTNLTKSSVQVHPIENDFIAGDERGTPALILDESKYAPTHSLKRFMTPLADVTIPAKQAKQIDVVINVPAGAQAGGYFGAVRFAPTTPDSGGQVNLSASVASIILLTVPGNIVEKMNLTNFDIQQHGKSDAYFQTPNDLQAAFRFQNLGSVQEGPFGKVSVKNGNDVVYAADFNTKTPRDMVLPDSARRWEIPLKNIGNFGHYTVMATFTYGAKNQTIEVTKSFWVIPQAYIIGAIIAVVVLIVLIVGIWLFLRSYKRRILGSSRRGYRR